MKNIIEHLEKINSESLRDGKGVIVHMDDYNNRKINRNKKLKKSVI
ncbi:hypothetical protein [Bacillus thuringiensis]|nr:hypothetical protein [Bacillus thuringiensis]